MGSWNEHRVSSRDESDTENLDITSNYNVEAKLGVDNTHQALD